MSNVFNDNLVDFKHIGKVMLRGISYKYWAAVVDFAPLVESITQDILNTDEIVVEKK